MGALAPLSVVVLMIFSFSIRHSVIFTLFYPLTIGHISHNIHRDACFSAHNVKGIRHVMCHMGLVIWSQCHEMSSYLFRHAPVENGIVSISLLMISAVTVPWHDKWYGRRSTARCYSPDDISPLVLGTQWYSPSFINWPQVILAIIFTQMSAFHNVKVLRHPMHLI